MFGNRVRFKRFDETMQDAKKAKKKVANTQVLAATAG